MSLQVSLTIDKADLLLGENTGCRLLLENTGSDAITLNNPENEGFFVYRVVQLDTGAEMIMKGEPYKSAKPTVAEVPPGGTIKASAPLLRDITWPTPGKYTLSVLYNYQQDDIKEMAESQPVSVTVRPLTVRNLSLDNSNSNFITGSFINSAADPPDIVLARFKICEGGGVKGIEHIGQGSLLTKPFKAVPGNMNPGAGEWIAWLDKEQLHCINWDWMGKTATKGLLKIPGTEAKIVTPVYIAPKAYGSSRSDGTVLLWANDQKSGQSTLNNIQLKVLDKKVKVELLTAISIPGPRPKWSMPYVKSDLTRRLVFLRSQHGKLSLTVTPWPGDKTTGQMRMVHEWSGEFVGASATLGEDDVLRGAVLMWTGQQSRQLELVGWTMDDAKGKIQEDYRETVPLGSSVPISSLKVKVRITGMPTVLMRKYENEWVIYDAFGKMMELPAPYNYTKYSLDFAFYGLRDVVLICAEITGGLSVKRMDGSDLPPKMK